MPHNEAPFSINFKPATGYDAPQITIRADSAAELVQKLGEAEAAGLFATAGNAHQAFKAQYNVAGALGAEQVDHMATAMQPPAFAQQAVQEATPQWGVQPATGQGVPQPPAPPVPPAPPQQPVAAAPAYAPPAAPAAPGSAPAPGAPMTPFGPAKLIDKGTWKAWADPRPQAATQHLGKDANTEDPQDPGLVAGTRKFWKFIR